LPEDDDPYDISDFVFLTTYLTFEPNTVNESGQGFEAKRLFILTDDITGKQWLLGWLTSQEQI